MSAPRRPPSPTEIAFAQAQDRALALPDRAHALRPAPRERFAAWRTTLERARSGSELLDAFISPADAPHLVPMLPVEDLHRAIHRIGLEDAVDILAMASGEQVQGLLDTEIWEGDELSSDRADPWLQALMAAGPDVLGRRLIDLDDELLNWLMRRSVQVIVVEEPDDFDPPDVEHVLTPDGRICICFPDPGERDLPVKIFMDWLMRTAPVYCIDLLIGSSAALDSSLQEDALRWRSGRLADRGYVDFYDALAIYAPPPAAPATPAATDDGPAPRHWLASLVDPEARLAAALERVAPDAAERLIAQLGYAANMALSADRREPWDLDGQAETLQRLRAGIVLGLDALGGAGADPAADAELLLRLGPSVVFRNGYARMLAAAEPLRQRSLRPRLRRGDDPVGAFDVPTWHAWAAGLCGRHPACADGSPIGPGQWIKAAAWARMLASLARVAGDERPAEVGVGAWLATGLARAVLGLDGFGPLPLDRFPEALAALFAEGRLRPEARARAATWWADVGDGQEETLACLLVAFTAQAASVDPRQLDPARCRCCCPSSDRPSAGLDLPRHQPRDRARQLHVIKEDLEHRRHRGGEDHAGDAPEHAPEDQGHEDGDGVQLQALADDAGLEHVADEHLHDGGQRHRQHRRRGRRLGIEEHDGQGQQRRQDGPEAGDEVEEEREQAEDHGQLDAQQHQDQADGDAGRHGQPDLHDDVALHPPLDLGHDAPAGRWGRRPADQQVDQEDEDEEAVGDEPEQPVRQGRRPLAHRQRPQALAHGGGVGLQPEALQPPREAAAQLLRPGRIDPLVLGQGSHRQLHELGDRQEAQHREEERHDDGHPLAHPAPGHDPVDERREAIHQQDGQHEGDHDRLEPVQREAHGHRRQQARADGHDVQLALHVIHGRSRSIVETAVDPQG
ncbi:MAG: DUF6178 family protein [bacterium]